MGMCASQTWRDDPKRLTFVLARYKFVAKMFSGFDRVLEVGCGCGAITRFLGENFDDVVSVEGSLNRARLARLRTRDLPGVTILCAPFQEIRFSRKFDVVFCITQLFRQTQVREKQHQPLNADSHKI